MSGATKLMTAGGGGVSLTPVSSIASDVTVNVPVTGVSGGTLVCSDSSGNVGIGTSSPSVKLDIVGEAKVSNGTYGTYLTYSNGNQTGIVGTYGNHGLEFRTNNTERMRIKADGGIMSQPTGGGTLLEQFGCRAWVNFNGTGTVAIRASGNVSSITDGGTGQYTINFTNAMPDANYTPVASGGNLSSDLNYNVFRMPGYSGAGGVAPTSSACKMTVVQTGVGLLDIEYVYFSVFR